MRASGEPKNAYRFMDVLRALAAIFVAASHVRDLFLQDYAGQGGLVAAIYFLTGFGHAAVIVFFVLSGFWITRSVIRNPENSSFWPDYLVNRLSRLWLVLIPALLLGGILDWLGSQVLHSTIYEGTSGASSLVRPIQLSMPVLLANSLFLQTIVAPVFGSNGPLWSLAYEFWFYIWFPALWLTIRSRRPSLFLVTLLVGLISPMVVFGFLSWLGGSLLYYLLTLASRRTWRRSLDWATLLSGIAAAAAMLMIMRVYPRWWLDPLLALAFLWFLLGLCLVNPAPPMLRRVADYGAHRSFSLYVIHYPIAAVAAAWLSAGGRMAPSVWSLALMLAVLVGTIAASFLFAFLTERHTARVRGAFLEITQGSRRH
jgi:peptidoglycan/LPS O-acetylase OafA/YrhL